MPDNDFLKQALDRRETQHSFRRLQLMQDKVDFCSNDYLGLARSPHFRQLIAQHIVEGGLSHGSTGSRLLAGNYALIEETEKLIAAFHQAPAALIFNSGYDANIGLFSSVPQKGDTVIYDRLIHASIRDGIRMSNARSFSFLHNDPEDLEKKLQQGSGDLFVAVESVYSMDGDYAPLEAIAQLCRQYNARLIVDEAHATGVTGTRGEGLVQHLQLQESCFARLHTFGKGLGVHGAAVLGSTLLRDYLINFARSFIYTTALSPAAVMAIRLSYQTFPGMTEERQHLQALISQFRQAAHRHTLLKSDTPIQIIMLPGNDKAKSMAEHLQHKGLDVRAILHPTVPEGQERLRIVLHSFNTAAEVKMLLERLSD